jgi:hypothetical protein
MALFPRHPQPVVPRKAVATQVVKQEQKEAVNPRLIIVERSPGSDRQAPCKPEADTSRPR